MTTVRAMTPALQLEGVVKKYRRGDEQVQVLDDFDFSSTDPTHSEIAVPRYCARRTQPE